MVNVVPDTLGRVDRGVEGLDMYCRQGVQGGGPFLVKVYPGKGSTQTTLGEETLFEKGRESRTVRDP